MYFLFVCWFISRLLYPKPDKNLSSVISRHRVFATRYGPINTRPRSAPGSRSLLLTVSDAATVAWPEPEWYRESCSDMIDGNGYQLFTAQKIKYWGKNSNKT